MADIERQNLTKYLCRSCRKTFKRPVAGKGARVCSHCGGQAIRMGHKFRPPKANDKAGWKLVDFMVSHGFYFDSVWAHTPELGPGAHVLVKYPETLDEAKAFVEKYARYATPLSENTGRTYTSRR